MGIEDKDPMSKSEESPRENFFDYPEKLFDLSGERLEGMTDDELREVGRAAERYASALKGLAEASADIIGARKKEGEK